MPRLHRIGFALFPVVIFASVAASEGCSSPSEGASVDASDDASTKDSGDALCTTLNPVSNTKCSPSAPCPAPFACFYRPGCDSPEGVCGLYHVCAHLDVAREASFCGCDGTWVDERAPYRAAADLCMDAAGD